jgi:hypothetical protein
LATGAAATLTGLAMALAGTGTGMAFDFTSVFLEECACAWVLSVALRLGLAATAFFELIPSMDVAADGVSVLSLARECTGFADLKPINCKNEEIMVCPVSQKMLYFAFYLD